MNRADADRFAGEWIRDWCERDVERIVSHYADDVAFVSPVAATRTGDPVVRGRDALFEYWSGVHEYETFRFTLERVVWDGDEQELVIVYTREIDGHRDRACELLRFDEDDRVIEGEAMYGAEIDAVDPVHR